MMSVGKQVAMVGVKTAAQQRHAGEPPRNDGLQAKEQNSIPQTESVREAHANDLQLSSKRMYCDGTIFPFCFAGTQSNATSIVEEVLFDRFSAASRERSPCTKRS